MPKPDSAKPPAIIISQVMRIFDASPPILRMSCSSCIACFTEPAQRNSSDLKKAWQNRWKMPMEKAPMPQAANM